MLKYEGVLLDWGVSGWPSGDSSGEDNSGSESFRGSFRGMWLWHRKGVNGETNGDNCIFSAV